MCIELELALAIATVVIPTIPTILEKATEFLREARETGRELSHELEKIVPKKF